MIFLISACSLENDGSVIPDKSAVARDNAGIGAGTETGENNGIGTDDSSVINVQTKEDRDGGTGEGTDESGSPAASIQKGAGQIYTPVTIGIVGDIYLGDSVYNQYVKADSRADGILTEGLLECFTDADIMVANHEYVSTDLPDEDKDTRQVYNFKAPTEREFLWREMGVDIVSLANNHAMDYGVQSLLDTLEILDEQKIRYIGAGRDLDEAKKAAIVEVNGKKIAFMAASRVVINVDWYASKDAPGLLTTYETTSRFELIQKEITRLKEEENCDFVAIYVHFGEEKEVEYTEYQELVAHGYIDAGADLVVGSHAHVLQGIEIYKGKPIYYNLGNFLFGVYQADTIFLQITVGEDNSCITRIMPCVSRGYRAGLCGEEDKRRILQYMQSISRNVIIDGSGNVTEDPAASRGPGIDE